MKRIATIFIVTLVATIAVAGGTFTTGWGKKVTAGTTPVNTTVSNVGSLSLMNQSGVEVFALVNTTTVDFTNRYALGTTIAIPDGVSFTFNGQTAGSIRNIITQTATGTGTVYLAGF